MTEYPPSPVHLAVESSAEQLPAVRSAVERMCQAIGFGEPQVGNIVLSTDEALTNIIRHAYRGQPGQPIEIQMGAIDQAGRGGIRIVIRDHGRAVPPEQIKPKCPGTLRPGGLGVHIMRECMDELDYRPADGGGTRLTMTKWLDARKGGGSE